MKVGEIVKRDVRSLSGADSLEALVEALEGSSQDVFPVLDAEGALLGTVNEVDLVRALSPSRRSFSWGPRTLAREGLFEDVESLMTPRPSTAREGEDLASALRRMESLGLPQLVVVDEEDRLIGLLRGRDAYCAAFRRSRQAEGT